MIGRSGRGGLKSSGAPRAPIGWEAHPEVRLGASLVRSEAEAAPGVLRAPNDKARGVPRRASGCGSQPIGALGFRL